jgi:caffeoyl-CoA O-methyltransferase
MDNFELVLMEVDKSCRDRRIPMLGPEKAKFLVDLIQQVKPNLIVECGTAIGYSGLWIASQLKKLKKGRLITVEIDSQRAQEARQNFERAGVSDLIDSQIGDASKILSDLKEPVDFLFLDNSFANYFPTFKAIMLKLVDGATILADNVGIGAASMADYLEFVRSNYDSKTYWFDTSLQWSPRDAMEVTIFKAMGNK